MRESIHGRQPGTLQALVLNREKKSRAILAELGLSAGSAVTVQQAAKEVLLAQMSGSEKDALTEKQLLELTPFPFGGGGTGRKALKALFDAGQVQRVGRGYRIDPYRYFRRDA